jgi:hypothetical protein
MYPKYSVIMEKGREGTDARHTLEADDVSGTRVTTAADSKNATTPASPPAREPTREPADALGQTSRRNRPQPAFRRPSASAARRGDAIRPT